MAKAYWIVTYRSEDDPKALAEYARLAGPTVLSAVRAPRIRPRGSCSATQSFGTSGSSKAPSSADDALDDIAPNSQATTTGHIPDSKRPLLPGSVYS